VHAVVCCYSRAPLVMFPPIGPSSQGCSDGRHHAVGTAKCGRRMDAGSWRVGRTSCVVDAVGDAAIVQHGRRMAVQRSAGLRKPWIGGGEAEGGRVRAPRQSLRGASLFEGLTLVGEKVHPAARRPGF